MVSLYRITTTTRERKKSRSRSKSRRTRRGLWSGFCRRSYKPYTCTLHWARVSYVAEIERLSPSCCGLEANAIRLSPPTAHACPVDWTCGDSKTNPRNCLIKILDPNSRIAHLLLYSCTGTWQILYNILHQSSTTKHLYIYTYVYVEYLYSSRKELIVIL
jgi:hypothetical protein